MQAKKLVKNKKKFLRNTKEARHERRMLGDVEASIDGIELLTTDFLAEFFGLSKQAIANWRAINYGPPFIKIGPTTVRYPKKALMEWIRTHTINPESIHPESKAN